MTIREVIERWRSERLKYDPALKSPDERVDELLADLSSFVRENGFTDADLSEELDDNPRAWVENEYVRVQKL